MKKKHLKISFKDKRGFIQDILTFTPFEHATFIFSKKNAVRGNHFHKKTVQYTLILSGTVEYHCEDPSGRRKKIILKKGDLMESPELEKHALKSVTDSEMLVLTRGPRGGKNYEKDTFRLKKPLV